MKSVAQTSSHPTVATCTSVRNASELDTLWKNAPIHLINLDPASLKFHRGLLWSQDEIGVSPTALSTTYDPPLPRPRPCEFRPEILATISSHPALFRIVTPINVERFQQLLSSHPNQPFVSSVLVGLREGFWPFAYTHPELYPLTHDASPRPPKTPTQRQFLIDQCQTEVELERFSPAFGPDLFPGMYSMPIHSVPKPASSKLRLVVDHSASDHSLNSMISRDDIAGTKLDTIKDLINSLLQFRREHDPDVKLVLFKSDVSAAYRRLPMHPLWQVKQVITVEGQRYIDRCNNFGNRGAQKLWVAVMALVIWIAIFVRKLDHIKLYTDDAYSFELASEVELYRPYNVVMPRKQALLLSLWDEIGIPHDQTKQLWGETLTIIGFVVDPNAMTVTMPPDKLRDLLAAISVFCYPPDNSWRHSLRRFMQLAGWINWALNVFPLLKPALSSLYHKIQKKDCPNALVCVNNTIRFELNWFSYHAARSNGIRVMESVAWRPADAHHVFFCDASLDALGCYLPAVNSGFFAVAPDYAPAGNIFFREALCVCWAIHIAHHKRLSGNIVIFTDNENTVALFNRLYSPIPVYNPILMSAVDILLSGTFRIQVHAVPGAENVIADALSRSHFLFIAKHYPELTILRDEPLPTLHMPPPPRRTLGLPQC
ncbi:hypothetical protein M378DRAFT_80362 [Amanita muscaria Koide BX008]|uniref:Uncharacterized protein n=1 Tax=Amanita muscaria (strain Koide BX008) TaxID=946122 RepID=A0A0C2X2U9_AMAMK|nr:hypothetical protein M378DRAFT_80362 [Amanita muscaria Koide BX008]